MILINKINKLTKKTVFMKLRIIPNEIVWINI